MSLGEFQLIQKLTARLKLPKKSVTVGPGDDCAVVRVGRDTLLLTTDLLVEGVHFRRDWMTPEEVGFKAMRVNLSDVAAMGGTPLFALISLGLPKSMRGREAERLFSGLRKAADEEGAAIIGGDTNASDRLIVNVALVGRPGPRVLLRSGAKPGDLLYVTGRLGESALGLEALKKRKRRGFEKFIRRHVVPPSRLALGRVLAALPGVRALMDLSDGLAGDLPHLLKASGVGASVNLDALPRHPAFEAAAKRLGTDPLRMLVGVGEDYELLFTASPRVKIPSKITGVPVTKIGKITPRNPSEGKGFKFQGFRHF